MMKEKIYNKGGEKMNWEITVGIDLALTGNHVGAGCDHQGKFLLKKPYRFNQTLDDYEQLVKTFVPAGIKSEKVLFLMEATGHVWMPITAYLNSRGFKVSLVKTQKSSDLRKFYKKNVKSDFSDAKTLARYPFIDSDSLYPFVLPSRDIFGLDRLTKQYNKLGKDIAKSKSRVQASFQLCNPKLIMTFGDHKFTESTIYFFKHYANPFKVKEKTKDEFRREMLQNIHGLEKVSVIEHMYEYSINHCRLLDDILLRTGTLPWDLDVLQDEIAQELRHIQFLEQEQKTLKKKIDHLYKKVDPDKVLLDFKGIGEFIAPVIMAAVGQFDKFPAINKMKAFLGFVPRKKQSAGTDRKGLKITKTGRNLLKESLYMAAQVARQWDVQFAHKYKVLTDRGLHHKQATCALANMLLARVYSVMTRRATAFAQGNALLANSIRYELRDLNNNVLSPQEARAIILRDYPSKRKAKQKKEKAPMESCSNPRQSYDSSLDKRRLSPKQILSKNKQKMQELSIV
jgi:transposase